MSRPIFLIRRVLASTGVAFLLAAPHGAPAAEIWFYTLGELRANQQGNFCATQGEAVEIANIFRKYGVRPGFSALSSSPSCELRVDSFTPREIIEEVNVVTKGADYEYTISFIRVEIQGGSDSFLITTREVREAK